MTSSVRFGTFFRQRRQGLGVTLREFCRRNGFDSGNLSRLERGLLAPPHSTAVLTSYAKALKLEPDSADWQTFFDLAAVEGGRIPPQIIRDPTALDTVHRTFRTLQHQSPRHHWTKATDLELWADFLDARAQLPRLVRRLIHATVNSLQHIAFPADEGIQRPGWDGIVETERGNAFVPSGVSVWEMGVDRDPAKKAQNDFRTRTTNPLGLDPGQTTFIFVTLRKWTKKQDWCDTQRKLGKWKDVRVYDSANLEEWLELAPGVDAWIARLLGRRPEGVTDIEEHWANLSAVTQPSLAPTVFLASRQQARERLVAWLSESPSALTLTVASPVEVLDFLAAYIASLSDAERDRIASRMVIVDTREAWPVLCTTQTPLLLIPRPYLSLEAEMIAEAVRQGHHVLLSSSRFVGAYANTHELSRPYRHDLEPALVASGITEEKAQQLAREAGGSLTVLKRRLARFPSTYQPPWSQAPYTQDVMPMLLAGGWDDANTGDQAVIAKLAGRSYEEVLASAHRLLASDDPPLIRLLTHWSLVSHEDAWLFLVPFLTRQPLDLFETVAIEVLSEEAPCYDVPAGERWYAALHGKQSRYSGRLCTGIAETLALLGAKSHLSQMQDPLDPARRAERVVRRILQEGATVKRWASVSSLLPILAEAAPEAFLDAVETDLHSQHPQLPELFIDDNDPFFSSCPHAGLLWALETLAWNPSLLTRVSVVLARLAQLDPGGRWANRPMTTLKEIFQPWFPQTAASAEQRVGVLKVLARKATDIAWRLLLALLPAFHTSGFTARPHWQDWAINWSQDVTHSEYWQQIEACADLLVALVGTDIERWLQVIEHFENLPPAAQDRFVNDLQNFDVTTLDTVTKKRLSDALRDKVNKHRSFPDAHWVLPSGKLDELDQIKEQLTPQDATARHTWLFQDHPQLANEREESWEKREKKLFQLRRAAVQEIFAEGGLPRVLTLVQVAPNAHAVGFTLAKSQLVTDDSLILPGFLTSSEQQRTAFGIGYGRGRFHDEGWGWIERFDFAQWTPEQAGQFLANVPFFERRTWDFVKHLGTDIAKEYWSRAFSLHTAATAADVEYAVAMLLQSKRPVHALHLLHQSVDTKDRVSANLLLDTLEAGLQLQGQERGEDVMPNHITYEIRELFKRVQSDVTVDLQRLARLEWGYLHLLDDGRRAAPTTLSHLLRTEPRFFVDLLCLIFRSDNEETESTAVPTEEQKVRAQNAYRLLMKWTQEGSLPGLQEDGKTVNEDELRAWVSAVRRLSAECGRGAVCDSRVGELFARSPIESDGTWPCIPIRDVIEEVDSAELSSGFEIGIYNKRGVVVKSPITGGDQERSLAQQYASYAEACSIEWPTTARALQRVARHYEQDAHREDAEAKARALR